MTWIRRLLWVALVLALAIALAGDAGTVEVGIFVGLLVLAAMGFSASWRARRARREET